MPIFGSKITMQEEVNNYLTELLTKVEPYQLTPAEQKKVDRDKAGFVMDKLMRKKFRRRIGEATKKDLLKKVKMSLNEGKPLHFCMPFGGYKHYWNPSHPEPDWAELFNFRYMTEYVLPIIAVHEAGVILEYISCDVVLPLMNNYPEEALQKYFEGFKKIIEWYGQYIPSNLKINFFRTSDKYDKDKLLTEIKKMIPKRVKEFDQLPKDEQEQEIRRSVRNVMWNGRDDLTGLNEDARRDRIILSRIIELAYYELEAEQGYLGNYFAEGNHIDTWFSGGLSPDNIDESLTLAGSYGSVVDFWIGRGVVFSDSDKLRATIISQQQYQALKDKVETVKINPPLLTLKNYQSIDVIKS